MIPEFDSNNVTIAYRMKSNINLFAHVGFSDGEEPLGEFTSFGYVLMWLKPFLHMVFQECTRDCSSWII